MDAYLDQHAVRIGRGEPLLLIHGVVHCKEGWEPVLAALGGRFEVVAIDLPGFGGADPLPVAQSDASLADFCEQVLVALGWPGTRDHLLLPVQGSRWAAAVPGSRLVKLVGLGHTRMPDDPAVVVDVIVRTAARAVQPVT